MTDSDVRAPRAVALINGAFRIPVESFEVDENPFFEADRFRIESPIQGLPSAYDAAWFSSQETLQVALYVGYPANPDSYNENDLTQLILGKADDIEIAWEQASLILAGRDLTGLLIDAPLQATWLNKTASGIAKAIATDYGFTAQVTAVSGTNMVGSFMGKDWNRLSKHSAWDLLTYLANNETTDGEPWVCYIDGQTLYFGPRTAGTTYGIRWPWDVESLRTRRNMLVSRDITVEVKSWHLQEGVLVVGSVTSKGHSEFGQTYVYVLPGLTPAEAKKKAQAKLGQLMSHELCIHAQLPGDPALSQLSLVSLTGTGTDFDTDFYPNLIHHEFGENGYSMELDAKNHAASTVVV